MILLGDCLEVMRTLPSGSVQCCITDPPYGMGKDFGNASDKASLTNLASLLQPRFAEVMRALNEGALIVCFAPTKWDYYFADWWVHTGATYLRSLRMYKPNDCTFPWRGWLLKSEAILLFSKGSPKFPPVINYHHDLYVFNHSTGELPKGMEHPSVKPLEVMCGLVDKVSNGGDLILDPFCGSGSTCVAAKMLGRDYLGIDISAEYCAIAEKRLADVTPLFDAQKRIDSIGEMLPLEM